MKEYKILLGVTKDNELVFGEFGVYPDGKFAASFDTVSPFVASDEFLEERNESLLECYGKEYLYELCEQYDCKPSELPEITLRDATVTDIIDCSLYSNYFNIPGIEDDIYFESRGCGQHDTRDEMDIYINKEFYDLLHEMWDKYHLEQIPKEEFDELLEAYNNLCADVYAEDTYGEETWIRNWLIHLHEEGEL